MNDGMMQFNAVFQRLIDYTRFMFLNSLQARNCIACMYDEIVVYFVIFKYEAHHVICDVGNLFDT